jgi:hypothetical protein
VLIQRLLQRFARETAKRANELGLGQTALVIC